MYFYRQETDVFIGLSHVHVRDKRIMQTYIFNSRDMPLYSNTVASHKHRNSCEDNRYAATKHTRIFVATRDIRVVEVMCHQRHMHKGEGKL